MPALTPRRLAFASSRHPRRVLALWGIVLVACIGVIATLLPSATTTQAEFRGTPEGMRGHDLMKDRLGVEEPITESIVIRNDGASVREAGVRKAAARLTADLRALEPGEVSRVVSPFDPGGPPTLISRDGTAAVISVIMAGDDDAAYDNVPDVLRIARAAEATPGVTADVAGTASAARTSSSQAEEDLTRGELMVGLPVALIVLLLVFRAVGALLLPLVVAFASVIVSLALTGLAGQISPLSFFITNMITTMGLAVGIDYALFVVSRYREERAAGRPVRAAVDVASATSGRAVGFSGLAVVVALVGLLIVPTSIFLSLALGAIFAVVVAVAASMTLLPATLTLMGDRIEWMGLPRRRGADAAHGRGFARVADAVMRRPVLAVVAATAVMLAAASPVLGIRTGMNGIESLPADSGPRQAYQVLASDFGAGSGGPVIVTLTGDVTTPEARKAIGDLTAAVGRIPDVGPATATPTPSAGIALVEASLRVAPTSSRAIDVVRELRDTIIPANIAGSGLQSAVTGESALHTDFIDITDRYLPIVVGIVLVLSFLVLLVAFRSIVVPVKAILMNLLSVGAAYGLLVLVFQHGVGADLLGFQQVDKVEAWVPLFLFAVLFGLSMDYHVFLLSRIREEYERTGDTPTAVRNGIASSARLITGAALIMVAVFGGFALGKLVMFQQMGFGLAVAVFLDAFVIRTVLVPGAMRLLGTRNWYLPSWLQFLPHVDVEGTVSRVGGTVTR
ncbi:MAG: MMPL family transporter [Thermoleophilia bacterium]|nr:MMPL family transporter [Thermoleophilia bacterium]